MREEKAEEYTFLHLLEDLSRRRLTPFEQKLLSSCTLYCNPTQKQTR